MWLSDRDCAAAWNTFFRTHCDALFELALLISADAAVAETALAATLQTVDTSVPPKREDLAMLKKMVAIKLVLGSGAVSKPSVQVAAPLLQSGLRPILQLDRFPRACFILRLLLGYATASCAQILGVEVAGVRALLQIGLIQFYRAVVGPNLESFDCLSREENTYSLNLSGKHTNGLNKNYTTAE